MRGSGRRQVSGSGGERQKESVKEMDGREKEKGRRAKEGGGGRK